MGFGLISEPQNGVLSQCQRHFMPYVKGLGPPASRLGPGGRGERVHPQTSAVIVASTGGELGAATHRVCVLAALARRHPRMQAVLTVDWC